ncbi:hypothetical protein HMPREF9003_0196 [Bifidobacterium dentium JCVIHMP022]|uniref:Uncharacterized protein n=1 Tax=Bifidobacterium dentium JCVIHMP022 TaxID=553191 RepID=A0AB72Z1S5_9BIFI|nr:hypothetical protein HMPREF9003_0196 [Bifidobacterium dentium JCVIHMP022]
MSWNPYDWSITCDHCGNMVSGTCVNCPHCGKTYGLNACPTYQTRTPYAITANQKPYPSNEVTD